MVATTSPKFCPLLHEDGRLAGPTLRAGRSLALSRALCRVHFFAAPAGLSRDAAARTAQLQAKMVAPFEETDCWISADGLDFTIWSWNAAQVRRLLEGRSPYQPELIVPETALHRPGPDGVRICQVADGEEVQVWRGGVLRASHWRRHGFTPQDWSALLSEVVDGTEEPPAPEVPALRPLAQVRQRRLQPDRIWSQVERGGWAAGFVVLAASAFLLGQGGVDSVRARRDQQAIQALESQADREAGERGLRTQLAQLQQASAPLAAAAEALAVSDDLGAEWLSWRIESQKLEAQVRLLDPSALAELTSALESQPSLRNVEVTVVGDIHVFSAEVIRPRRSS